MATDARIIRLRVKSAPGEIKGLGRARMLVEDALRTEASAAGPGATRGLLVLRGLDAGRAAARSDRRAIQRRVGEALADAGRRAVHPLDKRASAASAVLFEDPLQPFTLYAEALFRRLSLRDAWFFRAIFGSEKGRDGGGDLIAAGRKLLVRAAAKPFSPLAVPEVIDRAGHHAPALLSSLSRAEAAPILASLLQMTSSLQGNGDQPASLDVCEASPVDEAVSGSAPDPPEHRLLLPHALRAATADMARRLGTNDPRVQLLVAALLIKVSDRPVSEAVVRAVIRVMAKGWTSPDPARAVPAERPDVATEEAAPASPAPDLQRQELPEQVSRLDQEAFEGHFDLVRETSTDAARPEKESVPAAAPAEPPADENTASVQRLRTPFRGGRSVSDDVDTSESLLESDDRHPVSGEWDGGPPPSSQEQEPPSSPDLLDRLPFGQPTAWAGAVLAVMAVHRLLGPLVTCPAALDANLGSAVLERMLRRVGCSGGDAMLKALLRPSESSSPFRPDSFDLSAAFEVFGIYGLALHRIDGHPGFRALTCRGGRIVLAMWRTRAARPIRRRIQGLPIRRGRPLASDLISPLLRSAELTIRAAIRRLTGHPLRKLLERSGWVRSTRSHLDVTFDATLVDLGVRRAGLDLDPGWCVWLFRVVTIHYDYGRSHD